MRMVKIFRTCFRYKSKESQERRSEPVQLRKEKSTSKTSSSQSNTSCNYLHVSEIYSNEEVVASPSDDATIEPLFDRTVANLRRRPIMKRTERNANCGGLFDDSLDRSDRRRLSSSCSSVHVELNSLSQPNNKTMLKCVSLAVYLLINDPLIRPLRQSLLLGNVFKETNRWRKSVDLKSIYSFVRAIFYYTRLSTECVIVSLIYLERALSYSQTNIDNQTWRRMLLGAIILASKVWDDQAVWNVDFCLVVKDLTVEQMNELERQYLILVHFNIDVRSSVYAKYYFELRSLATSGIAGNLFGINQTCSTSSNTSTDQQRSKNASKHFTTKKPRSSSHKHNDSIEVISSSHGKKGSSIVNSGNKSEATSGASTSFYKYRRSSSLNASTRQRQSDNTTNRSNNLSERFDRLIMY